MTQTPYAPTQTPPPSDTSPQPAYTITDEDKARQKRIAEAWKAYDGEFEKPLTPMEDEPDDNVLENQCAGIVDGGVNFLFGLELDISVEEDAPKEAQEFLDSVWGRKERRVPLLQDLGYNGALAGTGFLRIVPSKQGKIFRLITVDPAIVCVQTAPQDRETATLYHLEYCEKQMVNDKDQDVYYCEEIAMIDPDDDEADHGDDEMADVDASWTIQHWTRVGNSGKWTAAGEPITWDNPFPPIFPAKNLPRPNSFWGKPDITQDIIGLNNALNLNESDINRLGKINGSPIITAVGMGDSNIDHKPGRIITLPGLDSKILAVQIAGDIANMRSFSEDLRSSIDQIAGFPGVATGRLTAQPRGDMSGVAVSLMYLPALKKTDGKRMRYGELIINVSKALLILNGMSGDIDITLTWGNPLPTDNVPVVNAAVAKMALGYSKTTLIRETGGDPDEEAELNKAEDSQTVTNFSRGQGMPPAPPQPPVAPEQPPIQPGQQQPAPGQPAPTGGQ
jgi:hypothetical protein